MMKFHILTMIIIVMDFLSAIPLYAQQQDVSSADKMVATVNETLSKQDKAKHTVIVYGNVTDCITGKSISKANVTLLLDDSTKVGESKVGINSLDGEFLYGYYFILSDGGHYILCAEANGYEKKYVPLNIKLYKREGKHNLPVIELQRKEKVHKLDEVTVTATKIKFFYKGDTLVYNADAFNLDKGSMLDELIRQLPGVQLKSNGEILVNGKKVESLLLQGKNFFSKDRSVLLQNLPSYTVSQVKVYEKENEQNELAGRKISKDTYVMDVKLKKEYQIGFMSNAETAYGTHDRYMEKLFGLRFTTCSRLSAYGQMNNVNSSISVNPDGSMSPWNTPSGLMTTKDGGFNYNVDSKNNRFKAEGSAKINYSLRDDNVKTNNQRFLTGGDIYSRSQNSSNISGTTFNTYHSLSFINKKEFNSTSISFSTHFNYLNSFINSQSNEGSYNIDPSNYSFEEFMDSINNPALSSQFIKNLINRTFSRESSRRFSIETSNSLDFKLFKINHSDDYLNVTVSSSYKKSSNRGFDLRKYDFPAKGGDVDFRNQYTKMPIRDFNFSAVVSYNYFLSKKMDITFSYGFTTKYNNNEHGLYRLDKLEQWSEYGGATFGTLPSNRDSMVVAQDLRNSYNSKKYDIKHNTEIDFKLKPLRAANKYVLIMNFKMPVTFMSNRLYYLRNKLDTCITRRPVLFNPNLNISFSRKNNNMFFCNWVLEYSTNPPNMESLVNVTDDSNPLQISLGNSGLKNRRCFNTRLIFSPRIHNIDMMSFSANYSRAWNDLATRIMINRTTGVCTTMPDNVSGNWRGGAFVSILKSLNKKKSLMLDNNIGYNFYRSVDLNTVYGEDEQSRSTVKNDFMTEIIKLTYNLKKLSFDITGNLNWRMTNSDRENFTKINAFDYNYGVSANWRMIWNMQLKCDLTMFSRRGYHEKEMNTDYLICNMGLSKTFNKANLTLKVDGFDLFNQISSVSLSINEQGRTETIYNTLPHYFMAHLIYRLNSQPKKKNKR